MVEIVFKLKQSGVPHESGKELVTKIMKKTHGYAAYDMNGG